MRTQYAARPWPELHLKEKFNVDLRPWYDIDVYDSDSIRVRLATGDIPDYLGGFNPAYVDLGIVRELPQDLIRTHMPGYMRWADHYLGDEVWRRTMVDGVNYTVPAALSMASTGQVIGFRGDWMQNLGYELEPVPGTDFFAGPDSLDEIEQLLLAFRNEDPDGNGRKDSYGYAVWKNNDAFQRTILPSVFGAYGVQESRATSSSLPTALCSTRVPSRRRTRPWTIRPSRGAASTTATRRWARATAAAPGRPAE